MYLFNYMMLENNMVLSYLLKRYVMNVNMRSSDLRVKRAQWQGILKVESFFFAKNSFSYTRKFYCQAREDLTKS